MAKFCRAKPILNTATLPRIPDIPGTRADTPPSVPKFEQVRGAANDCGERRRAEPWAPPTGSDVDLFRDRQSVIDLNA
jgi:hypothetical protein